MDQLAFARIWQETLATARRHAEILVPVAAAFMFLPQLIFGWRLGDATPGELFRGDRLAGDFLVFLPVLLASFLGQLTISFVSFNDGTAGFTLGQLLRRSALLLLPAFAASLMQAIAFGFGFLLFILPGIWLVSRLILAIPILASVQPDPVLALKESWRLTSGNSLRILGMMSMLALGFLLITIGISGIGAAIGVISTIATEQPAEGWGVGRWMFETVMAAASAVLGLLWICFFARLARILFDSRKA